MAEQHDPYVTVTPKMLLDEVVKYKCEIYPGSLPILNDTYVE